MKKIKLLPENLINQIAAGEVIERPASVVKELLENSIDAGAARVEVEISNGCRDIRVADNGHGIDKEDVTLAFSRHATSKINDQKDLWSISTLGFRGEALASIISVAKVICITKTADAESGIRVECENSEITYSEAGCATGTIMEVKELFYNIPARLKFMKKTNTELAAISETVQNIALANPHVAFNLINNKNSILKTTGSGDLTSTIGEIYSKNIISEFAEVHKEDPQFNLKVAGFVSNPDFVRSNKKAIYTFINGRSVKCPVIFKAIDTAYSDMIPSGKHPYAVLNISIPLKDLDINVHPAKREVKYINPNLIFNFVYSAIKSALENTMSSIPQMQEDQKDSVVFDNRCNEHIKPDSISIEEKSKILDFASLSKQAAHKSYEYAEFEEDDIQEVLVKQPQQSRFDLEGAEEEFAEKPRIIGQMDNTYILIQSKKGLQIIDQHIAHERYLYEKLKQESTPVSQMMLASEAVFLDYEEVQLLQENHNLLSKYGYELEFIHVKASSDRSGDNSVAIYTGKRQDLTVKFRKVPNIVAQKDPKKLMEDVLKALKSSPDTIEDELLIRTSCRAAVKAGEKLSLSQMEELIVNWQKTKYPRTCPHGRKICHTIPKKELAGFFGRI